MKLKFLLPLLTLLSAACSDYETFSDNPNFRLEFSQDTIAFDTLISTIPSSTKTLYAFNNNGNGMRVSTIQLEGGAKSLFRVNVDGRYLADGIWHDFEVLKHDSLVIRIEMTPPEVGSTEPLYFEDKLHFTLENGARQTVVLSGGSIDAYIMKGGLIIESDQTLLTDKAYVIYDSLVVKKGATLTLTEGTRLMFHDKAALHVYGKLLVQGSLEKPVVLRGDRMDHMFDYLLYDNTPSRWEGVVIHRGSYGNEFYQCDLHSSLFGIIVEDTEQTVPELTKPSVIIDCSIFHNIGGDGLHLVSCKDGGEYGLLRKAHFAPLQTAAEDHPGARSPERHRQDRKAETAENVRRRGPGGQPEQELTKQAVRAC